MSQRVSIQFSFLFCFQHYRKFHWTIKSSVIRVRSSYSGPTRPDSCRKIKHHTQRRPNGEDVINCDAIMKPWFLKSRFILVQMYLWWNYRELILLWWDGWVLSLFSDGDVYIANIGVQQFCYVSDFKCHNFTKYLELWLWKILQHFVYTVVCCHFCNDQFWKGFHQALLHTLCRCV